LKNIIVKKGQVIKYDIKYGGEPEPEVIWKINETEIKHDGDRYKIIIILIFCNKIILFINIKTHR